MAINVNQSVLDYKSRGWKISESQILYDSSYSRTWYFVCKDEMSVSTIYGNSVSDIAFFLNNNASNNVKIQCVANVNGTATVTEPNITGYGRLSNSATATGFEYKSDWFYTNYCYNVRNYSSFTISNARYSSNIPIFTTETEAVGYINGTIPISQALNYIPSTIPDGEEFEITNPWTHGTWTEYGHAENGTTTFRNVRGRLTRGSFALYYIPFLSGDTDLKYGISFSNDAEFYGLQYSNNGVTWIDTDTFPFSFFYRERVNEIGEFNYGLTCSNARIPEFASQNDADGYNAGTVDILNAVNWGEISGSYTPIHNSTADIDDASTMGRVYTRSFFSQQYICGEGALTQISNALFDTSSGGIIGKFEDIKKGLEMYGESVIDAVQGLMYFPLDLTNVFSNVSSQGYIYFGGYKFDLVDGASVNKIIYPNGYYDFGTFNLKPTFKNFRDYAPYTRLFCYLAYVGWVELDIARYINKTVSIRYYFDTRTGGCLACLFSGSTLVDYFNGQCGVQMPIKLTDYNAYANAQLQTLLGGTSGLQQNGQFIGQAVQGMMQSGAAMGALAVGGVAVGGIQVTKTLYGLTQNNINNFNKTKGASTSMLNQYLPQECCFMFEIQDADITPNELSLLGYPSNASGQLQEFNGYLEVDVVNLNCPYATDTEKAEIVTQLQYGVYI